MEYDGCGTWLVEPRANYFHHIIKRSKGGEHEEKNIALLCNKCHAFRHGITVHGYL
jgi:5-methylcytosine-specific restriction endonuclease McrA